MQFKVPQNVEREDRIVGPLTLKQLIICTIGFGMAYTIYVYMSRQGYGNELSLVPVIPIILLTVAITFVKINDIPFGKWVLLLLEFYLNAERRVWVKGSDTITVINLPQKSVKKAENKEQNKPNKHELHRLAQILDQTKLENSKPLPIDETDDNNLLHKAFTNQNPETTDRHQKLLELSKTKPTNTKNPQEIGLEELAQGGEIHF